jgi:hypothetical protein
MRVFYPSLCCEWIFLYVGFCATLGRILPLFSLPGERALKNSFMSDVDSKIKQYEDKFIELKMSFHDRAIFQTGIAVSRIFDNVESLGESSHILHSSTSIDLI